jgi:HEAT repeat protein
LIDAKAVMPMESELLAENQRLRQRVEELERQLEEWKRKFVIPMLLQRLLSLTHRDAAFEQLLSFRDEVVPILLGLLEKPLKTLNETGALIEREALTSDLYEGLRLQVIEGLVRLRSKEALKPLLKLLKSPNSRLKLKALWALGKLGKSSNEVISQIAQVLNDPDLKVREEAFALLGDLGDPAAIPLIIPFLGNLRVEGGFRAAEHAAKALESLGANEIVKAFRRTIHEGDLNALETLRPYRKPVIEALIRALDSYLTEHIESAARALKALNAVEALPKLRAKLRWAFFTLSDKARQACEDAFKHLENISRLPTPVSPTQIQIEGLPKPASPTTIGTENLPSPAKAPEENQ